MQVGRAFGLFMIIIGGIFTYNLLYDVGYTLKMFLVGPGLMGLGVAMLIFPGGDITAAQSRNKEKDPKVFLTEAPLLHKVTWVVGFCAGTFVWEVLIK